MASGILILQSLALGTRLDVPPLTVTHLSRIAVGGTTETQPGEWAMIHFAVDDVDVEILAERLAGSLEAGGHWYADFGTDREHVVVYPGKVFRYRVGDAGARTEAERYGESLGIPRAQLDWQD